MAEAIKNYNDLPLTLKVEQVAEILQVGRNTAYSLIRQKGFPVVRIGEKRVVIPRDRFLQWLNDNADKPFE